ncbi:EamA family transporter [Kutzneria kofuensis]|uniref:O-acetylserine/cysteine efflux transporter n=1 Tax=Kutzneria kofuensis TaxID=103725 RepID=A0A7W9KBF0_9PSEU|nr:EamA family transporter [Kutzneria kofuensis]MBB5889441.1 O-acetylserine/cysteine efflux transporter [Kutzneria kofuensis]
MQPRHLLAAVFVALVWGINFVAIDIGLESFPPLLFTAIRFAVAAVPAVFFIGRPQVPWRWVLAVGTTIGACQFGLLFLGIHLGMPAGLSSLVIQAQAVFTMVFAALLLGERPGRRQVVGMVIALAGIGLVALDYGQASPVLAFVLVLAAAASWALGNIATRKAAPPDAFRFMVWVSVVPPVPMLVLSALVEGVDTDLDALSHLDASALVSLGYVAWLSTLVGYGLWGMLIRRYGATAIAPYSLLVPVFGMSSSALVLHEKMSGLAIAAAGLVIVGVALTSAFGQKLTGWQRARRDSRYGAPHDVR